MPTLRVCKAGASARSMGWAAAIFLSFATVAIALPTAIALYLLKSALGINLMSGPSPLHDLLYGLVG